MVTLLCPGEQVSPDPCWPWESFSFLPFCANFLSVRKSLSAAWICIFDGWEDWASFHVLKSTSYNSFLCEISAWVICPVICWDLILRSSSWGSPKILSLWSHHQSPIFPFFLCAEVLSVYILLSVSLFCRFLHYFKPWEVIIPSCNRLAVKSSFSAGFSMI